MNALRLFFTKTRVKQKKIEISPGTIDAKRLCGHLYTTYSTPLVNGAYKGEGPKTTKTPSPIPKIVGFPIFNFTMWEELFHFKLYNASRGKVFHFIILQNFQVGMTSILKS